MGTIISAVLSIIGVLLESFIDRAEKDTPAEVAHSDVEEKGWKSQAQKAWNAPTDSVLDSDTPTTTKIMRNLLLLAAIIPLQGCLFTTRIIVVPHGKPFLTGEEVKGVKILTKDKEGNLVEGVGTIPAGWICAPLEDDN